MIAFACLGSALVILGMIGLDSAASVVLIAIFYGWFAGIGTSSRSNSAHVSQVLTVLALMAPMLTILTEDMSQLGVRMGISFAFASKFELPDTLEA